MTCKRDGEVKFVYYDLNVCYLTILFFVGNMLIPTITIVCRIDTLEKPLLQPRCVGFAVLKLSVDANGDQPGLAAINKHVYLNAGQYLLPIVYGSVPASGLFSESLMDKLPHISDAYLSVRLFDPSVEAGAVGPDNLSRGLDPAATAGRDTRKVTLNKTIIGSLLKHQPGVAGTGMPRLPIDDFMANEISRGAEVQAEEKKHIVRKVHEWLIRIFPPVHQKLPGVNTRYLVCYENRIGVFAALDMLYNMPESKKPMKVTQEAKTQLQSSSVFNKPYDDKITHFKTYFRYLPGSLVPKKLKGDATDFVIDDASMELDFGSKEYNPVFMDDFSRTTGFDLSPNACLLVVVTAVDVLTSKKADALNPTQYFRNTTATSSVHSRHSASRTTASRNGAEVMAFSFETEEAKKVEARTLQEKAFKLRGLVGVYFGYDDPENTWWGIVPLIARNPTANQRKKLPSNPNSTPSVVSLDLGSPSPKNKVKPNKFGKESQVLPHQQYALANSHASAGGNANGNVPINNWVGGGTVQGQGVVEHREYFEVPRTPVKTINNNVPMGSFTFSPSSSPSHTPAEGMIRNARMDGTGSAGSAGGVRPDADEYFVNAGTHQIPLFQGLPPEDMTRSSNPLAWMLSNLAAQERQKYIQSSWFCGSSANAHFAPPAVDLQLTSGASAMVCLVDPRLRQFCHESISHNPQVPIVQDTLLKVLRVVASKYDRKTGAMQPPLDTRYRAAYSKFEYNQYHSFRNRTMEAAVPHNILHESLIAEINERFTEKMSE